MRRSIRRMATSLSVKSNSICTCGPFAQSISHQLNIYNFFYITENRLQFKLTWISLTITYQLINISEHVRQRTSLNSYRNKGLHLKLVPFVRQHLRAQGGLPMRSSIRPKRVTDGC